MFPTGCDIKVGTMYEPTIGVSGVREKSSSCSLFKVGLMACLGHSQGTDYTALVMIQVRAVSCGAAVALFAKTVRGKPVCQSVA